MAYRLPCRESKRHLILLFFLLLSGPVMAGEKAPEVVKNGHKVQVVRLADTLVYHYSRPSATGFIRSFPGDMVRICRETVKKKHLPMLGLVAFSTGMLIALDQPILDQFQHLGDRIGLDGNNKLKPVFHVAGFPIELPRDMDTALYFIGDGWTHISIAGAFLGAGLIRNNNRALQTASQLAQGMLTTGFSTQLLKHITGRESPFRSSRDGGRWDFFPNQIEYHKHVPRYDAYPSGHLATAMMTVTVIAQNYPEKKFIRPVGYGLMTILSFEMVNNGVHWISDYPLALLMGYAFAKMAVDRGRTRVGASTVANRHRIRLLPLLRDGQLGLQVRL